MHESGGNPAQHRQLALLLRMLVESAEAWLTGLLIRFDGPTLQVDDKVLFVRLLERADDAGVARLARSLDQSVWRGVQRSVERLTGSSVLLGGSSEELLVCMIEAQRETDEGLEVTFDRHLLATWRSGDGALDRLVRSAGWDRREPTLDQKLQAFRPDVHGGEFPAGEQANKRLRKLMEDGLNSGPGRAVTVEMAKELKSSRPRMMEAVDRLASRLVLAWRFTWGHAFPLRGLPVWLFGDLEQAVACERTFRAGHELLMSKMHKEVGKIKTFGPHGPQYQVDGWPLIQLDDEDWLVGVTLVASGEKVEYRLSKVLEDPDVQ